MARYIGTTNTSSGIKTAGGGFTGGNQSANDLYVFMQLLAGINGSAKGVYSINQVYDQINTSTWSTTYFAPSAANTSPTSGGTMTVNSQSVGSYDYTVKVGNQTVSSFLNSDWFTTTADTRSALIYVSGNLTINAGQTFIPSNRKLFTAIYVNGNLTINGAISMSDMGSNHNGTGNSGGAVTAVAVRLATGTYGGVSNPQLPAAGGAGGPGSTGSTAPAGTAGTAGGTGGGGGGSGNGGLGGSGQAGTSFVGGSGGGGTRGNAATPGTPNGGSGGPANTDGLGGGGGGAGQPGGSGAQSGPYPSVAGATGIGGVIVIYCTGTFSGTGSIVSNGEPGGTGWNAGGGGSGAGSITVFYGTDSSSITPAATGGSGGPSNAGGAPGGAGGAGTARKLSF